MNLNRTDECNVRMKDKKISSIDENENGCFKRNTHVTLIDVKYDDICLFMPRQYQKTNKQYLIV